MGLKCLRNIKGQGIMTVVIAISIILMTSFSLYTIFWQTHLNANTQVREAYNLMNAMEQAAKDIEVQWDTAVANSGYGASVTTIQTNFAANILQPTTYCTSHCPSSGGGQLVLCYPNPNNVANPYCFYNGGITTAKLDLKIVIPNEKAPSLFEKGVEKVALLFTHWTGIHLIEGMALAGTAGEQARTDTLGNVPLCPSTNSSCMSCGNGNNAVCVSIYACPSSFSGCQNYGGTQQQALFAQQFYLIPPGAVDK